MNIEYNDVKRVMNDTHMDYIQAYHHLKAREMIIENIRKAQSQKVESALSVWNNIGSRSNDTHAN